MHVKVDWGGGDTRVPAGVLDGVKEAVPCAGRAEEDVMVA